MVHLDDRHRLARLNRLNIAFQILEERKDKEGKPIMQWINHGYYSRLQSALRAIPDHMAMSPAVRSLDDLTRLWVALSRDLAERCASGDIFSEQPADEESK